MNLINYSKHLVVAYFEITLIAYKLLRLILLRESPLVLSAPVAYCASTPFTVMSSFLHQDTEVLSETLVARIALIKDLLLKVIFKFVGKPLCPFFLFPSLVTLWLLLCYWHHWRLRYGHWVTRCWEEPRLVAEICLLKLRINTWGEVMFRFLVHHHGGSCCNFGFHSFKIIHVATSLTLDCPLRCSRLFSCWSINSTHLVFQFWCLILSDDHFYPKY